MGQPVRNRLSNYRLFWQEFRRTFHDTGAILPSGRSLARSLASQVGTVERSQRILEVGPGTGAVTSQIISRLGPEDQLDLVEINERFAEALQSRLVSDPQWTKVAERVSILQIPIEEVTAKGQYDVIVSGLPLNNFSGILVRRIVDQFHRLAAPQASLSFFEYVAIRKAKALISKPDERRRLLEIDQLLMQEFSAWEFDRQCVLANVPPAWVHHLQLPGGGSGKLRESRAAPVRC